MSQEKDVWLNNEILVGYTAQRQSNAWHYRFELQAKEGMTVARLGLSNNHFDGAIPLDVAEKFFGTTFSARRVQMEGPNGTWIDLPDFRAWADDETQACGGIHSEGFQGHQYKQWLYENVLRIVDEHNGLASCGYLKNRAVAFASIEMPENIKTKEGVQFRPWLMATTSFTGQIATTYKRGTTFPLCDNTVELFLREAGATYKVKHTRKSTDEFSVRNAQHALDLLHEEADENAAMIAQLCETTVTEAQFQAFLAKLVPLPEIKDRDINQRDYSTRTATIAAKKREALNELYKTDGRAAPWTGTAFGVLQAVNTYNQHYATIRKADSRFSRNMENVLNGKSGAQDLHTLKTLELVMA